MLLSDRRHMISGRGFIGIAAQSLGTGRPVLPRSWLPCCPASSPNRGADAGRYAEKHAKYTPLRFHGCGPSLLKQKGPRRHCLRGFVLL